MTRVEALKQKYLELSHAMQSGVAFLMNHDRSETDPKHLRVGVNSALVDSGALGGLLIKKGIITEEEYFQALTETMSADVESYSRKLEKVTGKKIILSTQLWINSGRNSMKKNFNHIAHEGGGPGVGVRLEHSDFVEYLTVAHIVSDGHSIKITDNHGLTECWPLGSIMSIEAL